MGDCMWVGNEFLYVCRKWKLLIQIYGTSAEDRFPCAKKFEAFSNSVSFTQLLSAIGGSFVAAMTYKPGKDILHMLRLNLDMNKLNR